MNLKIVKNWWGNKTRGETMIEVVIALVVIVIGSATAASLIITALKANNFSKDSLVALNLAQEGIEYMHNLRDTNWLRFSANTQGCWNMMPENDSCSDANRIVESGTRGYALEDKLSNLKTAGLDLSNGVDNTDKEYQLNYYDLNDLADGTGDEDATPDNDKDFIASGSVLPSPPIRLIGPTKFFRIITVDYQTLNNTNGQTNGSATALTGDIMQISSSVQWLEGAQVHEVKLSSALTRYK